MSDLNSVSLVGRLVRDVELKYTKNNCAHTIATIAVNRSILQNGKWENEANYINVEIWGKQAETVKQHSGSGKLIAIQGQLVQKRWETNTGEKKSQLCVNVNSVHLIP